MYPIVESILILIKPINREILPYIHAGNYNAACNTLFSMRVIYNQIFRAIYPRATLSKIFKTFSDKTILSFIGLRKTLYPLWLFKDSRDWARYLMGIERAPEMHIPDSLVSQVASADASCIVDVGCGLTPYALHREYKNQKHIIGIDKNFLLLYLSTIFFPNNNQTLILADLTHGFPIRPRSARCIFSLNCFTYLYNQRATFISMLNSAKTGSVVLVGDLHAHLQQQRLYWYPRSPKFYADLCNKPCKVFDYDLVLKKIVRSETLSFQNLPTWKKNTSRYGILTHSV
jgi:hypothetical protein